MAVSLGPEPIITSLSGMSLRTAENAYSRSSILLCGTSLDAVRMNPSSCLHWNLSGLTAFGITALQSIPCDFRYRCPLLVRVTAAS